MGALAIVAAWALYRFTDLLENIPFARALDWAANRVFPVVQQPWARGITGAVIIAAAPALATALLMGFTAFISWPISVALLLLCMGPLRLTGSSPVTMADGAVLITDPEGPLPAAKFHALAARDVVGTVFWAALLGAPGAVFYRAAREFSDSPADRYAEDTELKQQGQVLFGFLFYVPARIYAIALTLSGSGGELKSLLSTDTGVAASDQLVLDASTDASAKEESEATATAMTIAVLALAALVLIFK